MAPPIRATPHPNGGFFFQQGDQQPLHLMGDEANNMAAWSNRSQGAPPMNVSLNPAAGITLQPRPPQPAVPAPGQPSPGGEGQPGPAQGGEPGGPILPGDQIAAWALKPVYHPGTAAFDPEASNAARKPVALSRTVTGALDLSPEEEKRRLESAEALHAANKAAYGEIEAASAERTAAAEDRRTQALNSAIETDNERRDALAKRAAVEDTWNTTNAHLQKERDAVAEQRVDPQRLFKGDAGGYNRIMSAIAVGLGAFGAAISKTPNYALDIVNNAVQRDIDSQTDQIHRRGAAAQNAITDFQKNYGLTLDEARSAVKATQLRYAASMADMNAARIGTADAKQTAAVLKANFLAKASEDEANLMEKFKGRTATSYAMAEPRAATQGYYSEPDYKTVKGKAEAGKAINESVPRPKGDAAERNADLQEHKHVVEYGEKRRDLQGAERDMLDLAAAMGSSVNPDGTLTMPKGDIPGTGATSSTPDVYLTEQGRTVRRQRSRVISSMLKALTGMGVTKAERDDVTKQVRGVWDTDAVAGLQQALQVVRDHQRKLDASYGADVVRTYQGQQGETERMSTAKEKSGATPEKF